MSLPSSITVLVPPSQGTDPPVPVIEKVTVPVGTPVEGRTGATVAVNETGWPVTVGLLAEVTAVVVCPFLTTADNVPVLGEKFGSPEYTAVTA
jgi:hypothetical protein